MNKNNFVTIKTLVVRDIDNWDYIPVQISATKILNGKKVESYSSMINPMIDVNKISTLPKHLNLEILYRAPSLYMVSKEIENFIKGFEIEVDEYSKIALEKMAIKE